MDNVVLLKVLGMFTGKFVMNDETKKAAADAIRDLLKSLNIELDGKIRFDKGDQSVSFSVKVDQAQREKLVAELESMSGVTASFATSKWGALNTLRAAQIGVV